MTLVQTKLSRSQHLKLLCEQKQFGQAIKEAELCLNNEPDNPIIWAVLSEAYRSKRKPSHALAAAKQLTQLSPKTSESYIELGKSYLCASEQLGAEKAFLRSVLLNPKSFDGWLSLARLYLEQKRYQHAIRCYQRCERIQPLSLEARWELGLTYIRDKSYQLAQKQLKETLNIDPRYSKTWHALGIAYKRNNQPDAAIENFDKAIQLAPNKSNYFLDKGDTLLDKRDFKLASEQFEQAYQLGDNSTYCMKRLAISYDFSGRIIDALDFYKKSASKDNFYNLTDIELLFCKLGSYDQTSKIFSDKEISNPLNSEHILFYLNYHPEKSSKEILKLYRGYAERYYPQCDNSVFHHHRPGNKKIRLGYISPDFNLHACRHFYTPLFKNHNKQRFEVIAYANLTRQDKITLQTKSYVDKWRDIKALSKEQAADLIKQDEVDILVDLAGQTKDNRLDVMSLRPAPVQITYLGYGHTTGLSQIDYFIGDENFTPNGCESSFSEKLLRLDGPAFCYEPPQGIPEVSNLPAEKNGYVTFGSLSRSVRYNDKILKTWAKILLAVPESQLIIDIKLFADSKTKNWFSERLEKLGFPIERVILKASKNHWQTYQEIDISLDPFPHNGGTTIFESLWMGVPTLSKKDRPPVGRFGSCILTPLGLTNWLADTEQEYVDKAKLLASNLSALSELRSGLRHRLEQSDLMNGKKFTLNFEKHLQELVP